MEAVDDLLIGPCFLADLAVGATFAQPISGGALRFDVVYARGLLDLIEHDEVGRGLRPHKSDLVAFARLLDSGGVKAQRGDCRAEDGGDNDAVALHEHHTPERPRHWARRRERIADSPVWYADEQQREGDVQVVERLQRLVTECEVRHPTVPAVGCGGVVREFVVTSELRGQQRSADYAGERSTGGAERGDDNL